MMGRWTKRKRRGRLPWSKRSKRSKRGRMAWGKCAKPPLRGLSKWPKPGTLSTQSTQRTLNTQSTRRPGNYSPRARCRRRSKNRTQLLCLKSRRTQTMRSKMPGCHVRA
jgi:hypothetical protein